MAYLCMIDLCMLLGRLAGGVRIFKFSRHPVVTQHDIMTSSFSSERKAPVASLEASTSALTSRRSSIRNKDTMAESLQQSLRRQLLSAAAAGSAAFEISGVLQLSKPLDVFSKDNNNQSACVTFPLPGNDPTELQPLLDACSPAMFGKGRQTLHDEGVRKALALPADRLGLGLTTKLPSEAILAEIQELMMPGEGSGGGLIRAEAYGLNVCGPDGFFKAHRDTPASTDMFGSLIFCLPTEFSGGELIIRSPDLTTSVTHDWGSSSSDRLAAGSSHGKVAWAAMYSDCEHEIKPVTTGHRVTLTYNLYQASPSTRGRSSNSSSQDSDSVSLAAAVSTARDSAFGAALSAALSDASWYPEGVTLGIVLEHFYAVETIAECLADGPPDYYSDHPRNMPDSIQPDCLKGSDLLLHRAARAFGLEVKILPVVSRSGFDSYELTTPSLAMSSGLLSPSGLAVTRGFKQDPAPILRCSERNYHDPCEDVASMPEWKKKEVEACCAEIRGDLLWIKPPGMLHLKYCGPAMEY